MKAVLRFGTLPLPSCRRIPLLRCEVLTSLVSAALLLSGCGPGSGNGSAVDEVEASKASSTREKSGKKDASPGGEGSPSGAESPNGSPDADPSPEPSPDEDAGEDDKGPIPSTKFDFGAMPKPKEKNDNLRPCEIDFLFVVDNSGSMAPRQESLSASVPDFIKTMMNSTELEKDYHIGVVTTDAYEGNSDQCNFIGGLVVQTKDFSETHQCGPYKSGLNFMTDEDDLLKSFTCAAKPGIAGDVQERPMDALRGAIDPKHASKGLCNESFLRDEAILVAVIITDEDDVERYGGSKGNPEQWHKQLLAAKGGDEKKLVVISIVVPPKPNACGAKPGLAMEAENIIEFTKKFGKRGFVADVCKQNYDPIFKEALGIIDFACGELHPPPG